MIKRGSVCACISVCTAHAVHKTHKLHCIFRPAQSSGTVNYLTLASFQTRRPQWRATITLGLSFPLSASFYFNESTINKEMDQLPKGGWVPLQWKPSFVNGCIEFLYKATGPYWRPSLVSPSPPPHDELPIALYPSLFFSRSHELICATVSFDPPSTPCFCSKCRLYNT